VQHRIQVFADLLATTLQPGSRLLEIGAGGGELARALADAGHDVVAIDPFPRSEFPVLPTDFESYDAVGKTFHCIVASLVLHHMPDLDAALKKMRLLLRPAGFVAIDDYGWERLDDATARGVWGKAWRTERPKWLADRADLHRSDVMLNALDRHFRRIVYRDHAYFEDGRGSDQLAFSYVGRALKPN
jgi:SAM-dependent methyltransferase